MNRTDRTLRRRASVDLARPDNTELDRGACFAVEAAWYFIGLPILRSPFITSSQLRCMVLRAFGASVGEKVYIKPGLRVKFPWKLAIGDHSWIGEDLWIDNLASVTIGPNTCISQGAYLCTGNHDWSSSNMRLTVKPIRCEAGSWIGAKAVICPGVVVGEGAVVCAGSIISKAVPAWEIHGGNPGSFLRNRVIQDNISGEPEVVF